MMDYGHYDELNYFRSLKGPASLEEGYISEDASCSMALLVSLARGVHGIEVPVCKKPYCLAIRLMDSSIMTWPYPWEALNYGDVRGCPGGRSEPISGSLTMAGDKAWRLEEKIDSAFWNRTCRRILGAVHGADSRCGIVEGFTLDGLSLDGQKCLALSLA